MNARISAGHWKAAVSGLRNNCGRIRRRRQLLVVLTLFLSPSKIELDVLLFGACSFVEQLLIWLQAASDISSRCPAAFCITITVFKLL
ncbi:hypothetical protein M514_09939 [Trichuris suis]|uniref:Uncharacterized protein n=1 Tax=Trichuris suis TaxID=68888 RepID=A0A085N4A6_9BILA|nr:hypothetical protein M513_09939 [Trichuris suis]KFD64302.1 hypothetical protein M514_09939 [Trichuris suis]